MRLILLAVLLSLLSCKDNNEIIVIDSCEYIYFKSMGYAHKGNCRNPIHIYKGL